MRLNSSKFVTLPSALSGSARWKRPLVGAKQIGFELLAGLHLALTSDHFIVAPLLARELTMLLTSAFVLALGRALVKPTGF